MKARTTPVLLTLALFTSGQDSCLEFIESYDFSRVVLTSPQGPFTEPQTVTLQVSVNQELADHATRVEFFDHGSLDQPGEHGTPKCTDDEGPEYTCNWSITADDNGSHRWNALAHFANGQEAVFAAPIELIVDIPTGPVLAPGFQETEVGTVSGQVIAVRFADNDHVFIPEKSGIVWLYEGVGDASPAQLIDLRASVHNFWDRGLLGLAVDPDYPADPYIYVLYSHDTWPPDDPRFGDPTQPRWGTGEPSPSQGDPCPNPPGATNDGCVIFGRLSRIEVDPESHLGTEQVLLEANWCQQYPSHSTGDLVFGADGNLYASAGDGAGLGFTDVGQKGTPINPCDDPPDGTGGPNDSVFAEGGALRSQDILTPNDPTAFNGAILRIDVSTVPVQPPPDNPLVGNGVADDDLVVAMGLRNPYRINRRPGTNEIWVADVGRDGWEEINRIQDPTGNVENFGWPCYEGGNGSNAVMPSYSHQNLCQRLYGNISAPPLPPGIVSQAPYYAYAHDEQVVPGELCAAGGSSITALAFNPGGQLPEEYDGALFFADSSRGCIWTMFADEIGNPDKTNIAPLVSNTSGRVVDMQFGKDGKLYYADFDNRKIYRIDYIGANQPVDAVLGAAPTHGPVPLTVQFDGSDSTGGSLVYSWDLDADGDFDDSLLPSPQFTYTQAGTYLVSLRVENAQGTHDSASTTITVGNSPPVATITAPAHGTQWAVGDVISFAGEAIDSEDGVLPASQLSWEIILHHCERPDDCHEHPVTSLDGVASADFDAPDHEYPAFLELRLTATDLPPSDWFDTAWAKRQRLTFDNVAQVEDLVDFPVLVILDPSRIDYSETLPNGRDLRFVDASGTPLAHEIEHWDPTGRSFVWVKAPSISGQSGSEFVWMYYANPSASTSDEDPDGVFSNDYAGVWHLSDDLSDSTANGNDGVNQGTSDVTGWIGDSRFFDGESSVRVESTPSTQVSSELTLQAWIQLVDSAVPGARRIVSKKLFASQAEGYNLEYDAAANKVMVHGSGANSLSASNVDLDTGWHWIAAVYDGTGSGSVYVDGNDVTTDATVTSLVGGTTPLHLGTSSGGAAFTSFHGSLDEVRVAGAARSADWIMAQYRSMTDAFIDFGPEEEPATLSDTASLRLDPKTVVVNFASDPPLGFELTVGAETEATPFEHTLIVGSRVSVHAPSPQQTPDQPFDFSHWSDDGAQTHLYTAPESPDALVAHFAPSPESSGPCGLGAELAAIPLLWLGLGNRRRRRQSRE